MKMKNAAKFSWTDSAYASVWLIFLGISIVSLATDDMPNPQRTFGFVFLIMFALMYPVANGYLGSWPQGSVGKRVAFWWAVLCIPIIGFSIFVSPLFSYVFFPTCSQSRYSHYVGQCGFGWQEYWWRRAPFLRYFLRQVKRF